MREFAGYSWPEGKTSSGWRKALVMWSCSCGPRVVVRGLISASVVEQSAGEVYVEKLLAPLCNPRPDEAKVSEVGGTEELSSHGEMMDPGNTKVVSRRGYPVNNGYI